MFLIIGLRFEIVIAQNCRPQKGSGTTHSQPWDVGTNPLELSVLYIEFEQ